MKAIGYGVSITNTVDGKVTLPQNLDVITKKLL
jgi:hypothetical protein